MFKLLGQDVNINEEIELKDIKYNLPFWNEDNAINFEFKNGKIVKAKATKNEKFLKGMIATDSGSSYLGELGIGINYNITKYTKNLLFDEKIGGTIHLAIGDSFPEAGGKNKSAMHLDIIKEFKKSGGEIYFDNKLVFRRGKWLVK